MDGVLVIDKPAGLTSHDVVNRVRRIFGTRRVGHTGTLDPFATGVLVVLLGKATRLAQFLDKDVKEYVADVQFGSRTDTGDISGLGIWDCGLRIEEVVTRLRQTNWDEVLAKFRGEIMQTPPMYSAKKVAGKKLYELARKGEEIERAPVPVTIHELEMTDDPGIDARLEMRVVCSAGTYVRTLAEDIGEVIRLGAHLAELRRTAAGRFKVDNAFSLEELESMTEVTGVIIPTENAVPELRAFELREDRLEKTKNGLSTRTDGANFADGEFVRMISGDNALVAIGVYEEKEKSVRPKVVLI